MLISQRLKGRISLQGGICGWLFLHFVVRTGLVELGDGKQVGDLPAAAIGMYEEMRRLDRGKKERKGRPKIMRITTIVLSPILGIGFLGSWHETGGEFI